jgi:hypothetical protein
MKEGPWLPAGLLSLSEHEEGMPTAVNFSVHVIIHSFLYYGKQPPVTLCQATPVGRVLDLSPYLSSAAVPRGKLQRATNAVLIHR